MPDMVNRTACGLYVIAGTNPLTWSNFSWTAEVADMPGTEEDDAAIMFIRREIMEQLGEQLVDESPVIPSDVAFSVLHPGCPERIDYPNLDFADPEVYEEPGNPYPDQTWTVCGIIRQTWQPFSLPYLAGSAAMAYLKAWEQCKREFGYLLLCAVHPGEHSTISGYRFADPFIKDGEEMLSKTREEWRVRDF